MRIAIAQIAADHVVPGDAKHYENAVMEAASKTCRVVFLPELSDSGYDLDSKQQWNPSLQQVLADMAQRWGIWLVAGMRLPATTLDSNALLVFSPEAGITSVYKKMHVFSHGGIREDQYFEPGNQPVVASIDDTKVGLSLCFDLRFPQLYRTYACGGAEILLVSAAWPKARISDWQLLLRARALENQAYTIGVNYCGQRGSVVFGGNTMVCNPDGSVLSNASIDDPTLLIADLDLHLVHKLRQDFPVLQHARNMDACV